VVRPPGQQSDHQPLYGGVADCLGSRSDHLPLFQVWSDHQPLFQARSDHPNMRFDRQLQPVVESLVEHGALAVVRVWEPHRESNLAEKHLNDWLDGARQKRNLLHKKHVER
jgi:hypothetical protein